MTPPAPPWLIQPLNLSDFNPSFQTTDPGFSQLAQDTLGNAGTSADGFDDAVTEAGGILDALDGALGEQDVALDTVLAALDAADVQPVDNSFSDFAGTAGASASFLHAAGALAPPELLELPLQPSIDLGPSVPAVQASVDLGTVHLTDKPLRVVLGKFYAVPHRGMLGQLTAILANGNPAIWHLEQTITARSEWGLDGFNELVVTPAVEGDAVAQVNTGGGGPLTITTYTVHIVP